MPTKQSNGPGKIRDDNMSEITIYQNAIEQATTSKRDSSSSEERMDTSEEYDKSGERDLTHESPISNNEFVAQFIAENTPNKTLTEYPEPQPHCSREETPFKPEEQQDENRKIDNTIAEPTRLRPSESMTRRSESKKVHIYSVPGKTLHSALLDEDYLIVGNHVDEITRRKIGNGEYVDFSKLMPKDRLNSEEDQRMEMVNRGGMTFWVPLSDRELTSINSYSKWEQAFRVFTKIYGSFFPEKTRELIQYQHTIFTAAGSFAWDNVYKYDREFRMHMSRHHPHRNWSVILQQAWSMYLKDKVSNNGNQNQLNSGTGQPKVRCKLCYDFNSGNCTFGRRCKFDHRCSFCNKYGHGSFNCQKANKSHSNQGGNSHHHQSGPNGRDRWDRYEKDHQNQHQSDKKN